MLFVFLFNKKQKSKGLGSARRMGVASSKKGMPQSFPNFSWKFLADLNTGVLREPA